MEPILDFELTLTGSGVADEIRAAFESIVNALRDENQEITGTLTIDGVPYEAIDVPDLEDFGEGDGEGDQSDEEKD